jgi:excisionase family DNA binding protein
LLLFGEYNAIAIKKTLFLYASLYSAARKGKRHMATARLLKVPEAAETLALSQKTIWQWIGERRISVVRLGRAVRIPLSEIERLLEQGTTPAIK